MLSILRIELQMVWIIWQTCSLHHLLDIVFGNANVIKESLRLCRIHTVLLCLRHSLGLLNIKEIILSLHLIDECTADQIRHLRHSLISHIWTDLFRLEKLDELSWNFTKHLSRQSNRIILKLFVWHKLDNVSWHILLSLLRKKWLLVCVQRVHCFKIGISNSNNYNWKW